MTVANVSADSRQGVEHVRRSYRFTFFSAVALAVVGTPLLMQGVVGLVAGFSPVGHPSAGSVGLFSLSALPMFLAWLAWRRTVSFRRLLDEEP